MNGTKKVGFWYARYFPSHRSILHTQSPHTVRTVRSRRYRHILKISIDAIVCICVTTRVTTISNTAHSQYAQRKNCNGRWPIYPCCGVLYYSIETLLCKNKNRSSNENSRPGWKIDGRCPRIGSCLPVWAKWLSYSVQYVRSLYWSGRGRSATDDNLYDLCTSGIRMYWVDIHVLPYQAKKKKKFLDRNHIAFRAKTKIS